MQHVSVLKWLRRKGVRTKIKNNILQHYYRDAWEEAKELGYPWPTIQLHWSPQPEEEKNFFCLSF